MSEAFITISGANGFPRIHLIRGSFEHDHIDAIATVTRNGETQWIGVGRVHECRGEIFRAIRVGLRMPGGGYHHLGDYSLS